MIDLYYWPTSNGRKITIMLHEVAEHLKGPTTLDRVCFVLFDAKALAAFDKVLREMQERGELEAGPQPPERS